MGSEVNGDIKMAGVIAKPLPECLTGPLPHAVRISHKWGCGDWHHPAERQLLEGHIKALNAKYGVGTHWIETKEKEPTP